MGEKTKVTGFYKWDATDQIEETVSEQTQNWENLEARLVAQGGYNVKDFGALGNYKLGSNGKPLVGDSENASLNDVAQIQDAFNKCRDEGGGIVYFPKGNYPIKTSIKVYKNTHVYLHPQARIYRNNGLIGAFFANGDTGASYSGYDGHGNITISGGYFDGNIQNFDARFNFISFGHGYNILIENIIMKDCQTYHAIEINSSKKVVIRNCTFDGWTLDSEFQVSTPDRRSEAIQFDGAYDSGVFGRFGAYDNTVCQDCIVTECTFINWNRGVGSHTGKTGYPHRNIRVLGNHFENITDYGVVTCMWEGAIISGNTFESVGGGVWIRIKDSTDETYGYIVDGNTFRTVKTQNAIRVDGLSGSDKRIRTVTISDNTIENVMNDTGIYVSGVYRLNLIANAISNLGSFGIYVGACGFGSIQSNSIMGATLTSLRVDDSRFFTIADNMSSTSGEHGIQLMNNSSNNTCTGNVIRDYSQKTAKASYGITCASSSSENVISNNNITGQTSQGNSGIYATSTCNRVVMIGNIGGGNAVTNSSVGGVTANNLV